MATATFQPSGKDTNIRENVPTTNYGSDTDLLMSAGDSAGRIRVPLEFPIVWGTDIPAGATLIAATLSLYIYQIVSSAGETIFAYRLTRTDWVELESTWNIYKTGSNWTAAGGDYTTDDGASAVVPADPAWMDWDILAQAQYAQTNTVNVEALLRHQTEFQAGSKYIRFRSNNYTNDLTLRPKLVVTYSLPATTQGKSAFMPAKLMRAGVL